MAELLINIPDKLYQKTYEILKLNNISIDEIIAASLAEKLHKLLPDPYLEERAERATGEGFLTVMSQVPDVTPDEYDRMIE
ncbi:putative CopG/DNA-binding domain-containing protein [Desulfamplus magnetovallimortis]|uniref:Putative CopG/DNA-binding domain-containing protein n=1 Tax=Desulfamplus magnetovallimortis TaxID=1246637 RepID=A0A1W1H6T6_9BACT|nr:hypothetical protein [Desulfamplus magnetovallimortis]SLM28169.1 putative CopG/DNA-binding domain-containing protein [Desulfamplus magnetovallimortis]